MKQIPLFDRLSALADPTRSRLLLLLERHELTVSEIRAVSQLPQSTVSRHLKVLFDGGWLSAREEGPSNRYRFNARALDPSTRRLWSAVREEAEKLPTTRRDAQRLKTVLADRHSKSQAFFAHSAGQWDKLRSELFGSRTELLALLGLLDPDHTVGDLGCGTGHFAAAVAPFVHQVIAVDESAAMLKAARSRLSGIRNVELKTGSVEELPIDDNTLDVAVLSLVLHFIADPQDVFSEIKRCLNPGGRLIVVDMMPHDREEYRATMGHLWLGFDPEQIVAWGEGAGFRTVRYQVLPDTSQAMGPSLFAAVLN